MKRIWLCTAILAVIVAIGVFSCRYAVRTADSLLLQLQQVNKCRSEEDYEGAYRLAAKAQACWDGFYEKRIFIADKENFLEIAEGLARITALAEQEDDELIIEIRAVEALIHVYKGKHELTVFAVL